MTAPVSPPKPADDPFSRDVFALFGLPFDRGDTDCVAARVQDAAAGSERLFLSTVNLDWLVEAARDPGFRASAVASDHVTLDGVPVVKLAQMAGVADAKKAAGSDVFDRLRAEPLSVFFFGGRQGAAKAAHDALSSAQGPMRAVGWHDPGHGDVASMSVADCLDPINRSGADLLVVALGAKKGQAWLMANRDRLATPVITHLGAVVDFTAGTVARAPRALQVSGLEWAWRIGQDPALWRRYARDFEALPRLVATASRIRQAVTARRAAAERPVAVLERDGGNHRLRLGGSLGADDLRTPLRAAFAEGGDLSVTFENGAAPDLFALGQLAIARGVWHRTGRRYDLCTPEAKMVWLLGRTLGDPPGL